MLPQVGRSGLSLEEFLSLPESHDRVEFVDGEVLLSPSPSPAHQAVVLELAAALRRWCRAHPPAALGLSPLDLRIGASRIVQPDLFVVAAGFARATEAPVDAVPDLVVEVLSQHRSYDRLTKRLMYAEAGIPEYWIVDPTRAEIEQVAHLETVALVASGTLTSRALPDLALDVEPLFL